MIVKSAGSINDYSELSCHTHSKDQDWGCELITEIFIKYSNIRLGCGYIYLKRLQTGALHDFTFKFLEFLPLVSCQVEFNERQLDTRSRCHLEPRFNLVFLLLWFQEDNTFISFLTNRKPQPSDEQFLPPNLSIISECGGGGSLDSVQKTQRNTWSWFCVDWQNCWTLDRQGSWDGATRLFTTFR